MEAISSQPGKASQFIVSLCTCAFRLQLRLWRCEGARKVVVGLFNGQYRDKVQAIGRILVGCREESHTLRSMANIESLTVASILGG